MVRLLGLCKSGLGGGFVDLGFVGLGWVGLIWTGKGQVRVGRLNGYEGPDGVYEKAG